MPDYFLHGVEVVEIDNGPRPIRTARSSVIGLIGTAPEAMAPLLPMMMSAVSWVRPRTVKVPGLPGA